MRLKSTMLRREGEPSLVDKVGDSGIVGLEGSTMISLVEDFSSSLPTFFLRVGEHSGH